MVTMSVRLQHMRDLLDAQRPESRLRLRETRQPACINDDRFETSLDDPNVAHIRMFTAWDAASLENRQTGTTSAGGRANGGNSFASMTRLQLNFPLCSTRINRPAAVPAAANAPSLLHTNRAGPPASCFATICPQP